MDNIENDILEYLKENYHNFLSKDLLTGKKFVSIGHTFDIKGKKFIVKGDDPSRISGARKLEEFIKVENIKRFRVAWKKMFRINDYIFIIAEYINPHGPSEMSCVELGEALAIQKGTGFCDWNNNIIRDEDGMLNFIDTEKASFE